MSAVREVLGILLDALLGSKCHQCDLRVFPKDRDAHGHWWTA